ncbi:hypothetical protein J2X19_001049 [Rhodoferax ferrireducens]|uniref:N-acetylmuramoyl-L-alanine amidase domain-containing protein n=1 Tax=Rhodoferax ferrireducens TaxID=192843 RepID=A0ABU2C4X3_9BURK|nr:hypothetical protein [Rhodoferax ferrireducens]MDR7376391.1 hypothetical protein [Rhodoferax ferrireducens]
MELVDGNQEVQRVGLAKRRQRPDICVHHTVKNDVGVAACGRSNGHWTWLEFLPTEKIGELDQRSHFSRKKKKQNGCRSNKRGSNVGMQKSVKRFLLGEDVIQGLGIDEDIRRNESNEAYVAWRNGMDRTARTEVEWCKWHFEKRF